VVLQGGLPVEIDGQLVGAIGVSGVKASDDEIVAQAGIDALRQALA
jgi:glc operon protein GlcG